MEQRVRSDYNITSKPILVESWPNNCSNRQWLPAASPGNVLNGQSRVMSDYVIPRFHQRQKAGERFFNNMYKEEVTVSTVGSGCTFASIADACPGVKALTRVGDGYVAVLTPRAAINSKGQQLPLLLGSLSDDEIARAQRLVSTETLAQVGTGDSDLWESVAEYRQVIDMLQNPLTRLSQLSDKMLKSVSRNSTGRQLMREVSDGYLLYRYGVTPLMGDIKAILSSLDKEFGTTQDITSRAKEALASQTTSNGVTVVGSLNAGWQSYTADSVTIRGMSLDRGHVSLANNLGFNLKGLMMLPWQLTTYSFVADWFANFGSYIQATLPTPGWTHIGGCLVTVRAQSTRYTLTNVINNNPGGITLLNAPQGVAVVTRVSTTRSPLSPASFERKLNFKFDEFKRAADAVALIASRFTKVSGFVNRAIYPVNTSRASEKRSYERWAGMPDVR
jgi:hypothetical protein